MAQDKKYQKPAAEPLKTIPEPEVTAPDAETPKAILIRSTVGVMVHPFKGVTFTGEKALEFVSIDSWLQAQIDAGKLVVVVD